MERNFSTIPSYVDTRERYIMASGSTHALMKNAHTEQRLILIFFYICSDTKETRESGDHTDVNAPDRIAVYLGTMSLSFIASFNFLKNDCPGGDTDGDDNSA